MKGLNPERIPELIKKDVELVKKEARFVFIISPDETIINVLENEKPRLNVFVVIGPSDGFGRHWDEALLAEIGISRTRPYTKAKGLDKNPDQSYINKRRKWFSLSGHQYQMIAPIIFRIMDARAQRIVSLRKSGSPSNKFWLPATNHWWLRSKKRLLANDSSCAVPPGIRFSVSLKDEFFIRDIFWAELNSSKHVKNLINGLANFISLRMHWYNTGRGNYKGKMSVNELVGYKQVKRRLESCFLLRFPHLMVELAKKMRQDSELSYYFPYLVDVLKWDGQDTEESRLASLAPQLPEIKKRLGKIQIFVTADLSKKRDFITFEVQK